MTMRQNRELVLRLYKKFDQGELDDLDDTADLHFVANVLGTTVLDWEGFKQFGRAFRSAFPDGRHVFDHICADGENVVTIGSYVGVHGGEIQGIAPTNRQLRLPVMHLDRVVNGRWVEHRGLANEADFLRQLGAELVPSGERRPASGRSADASTRGAHTESLARVPGRP